MDGILFPVKRGQQFHRSADQQHVSVAQPVASASLPVQSPQTQLKIAQGPAQA